MYNKVLRATLETEETQGTPLFINGVMFNTAELIRGGYCLNYELISGGCGFIADAEEWQDFLNEYGFTDKDFSCLL